MSLLRSLADGVCWLFGDAPVHTRASLWARGARGKATRSERKHARRARAAAAFAEAGTAERDEAGAATNDARTAPGSSAPAARARS